MRRQNGTLTRVDRRLRPPETQITLQYAVRGWQRFTKPGKTSASLSVTFESRSYASPTQSYVQFC